jgi:predicted DNA-binding transcriptional regulator AlpA
MSSTRPIVVRPKEAKRMLGVGKTTLFEMLRDGRLVKVKLGPRAVGVTVESIYRLIKAGTSAA